MKTVLLIFTILVITIYRSYKKGREPREAFSWSALYSLPESAVFNDGLDWLPKPLPLPLLHQNLDLDRYIYSILWSADDVKNSCHLIALLSLRENTVPCVSCVYCVILTLWTHILKLDFITQWIFYESLQSHTQAPSSHNIATYWHIRTEVGWYEWEGWVQLTSGWEGV